MEVARAAPRRAPRRASSCCPTARARARILVLPQTGNAPAQKELSSALRRFQPTNYEATWSQTMRPVLLWALGIPIPIIILLYLFNLL